MHQAEAHNQLAYLKLMVSQKIHHPLKMAKYKINIKKLWMIKSQKN